MAKPRRRHRPSEKPAPEIAASDLTPSDLVDPRLYIDPNVPDSVKRDPLDLLRWARVEMPGAVLGDDQARARRESLDAQAAWRRARMEARRAGRPLPELSEFLPGVERLPTVEPS
jgi:hypothetical protein